MSVYVDATFPCTPNGKWRWLESCHMCADTVEELHEFAAKMGLKRAWFQNHKWPHYDLHPARRVVAVRLGAIEVDRKQFIEIYKRIKERR